MFYETEHNRSVHKNALVVVPSGEKLIFANGNLNVVDITLTRNSLILQVI